MKPRAPKHAQTSNRQQLDSVEMKKLLSNGDGEEDAPVPGQRVVEEEGVRGLGYAAGGFHGGESTREILGGVGISGTDASGGRGPSRIERERDHGPGRRSRSSRGANEEHERDGRHRRREKKRHRKEIGKRSSRRSRSRSRERSHRRRREDRE